MSTAQSSQKQHHLQVQGRMSSGIATDTHGLCSRLGEVFDGLKYRQIADITGFHPETVRRYMTDGKCSTAFVSRVAELMDVNGDWLLTGRGQAAREKPARELSVPELLDLLATAHKRAGHQLAEHEIQLARLREEIEHLKRAPEQVEPKPAGRATRIPRPLDQ